MNEPDAEPTYIVRLTAVGRGAVAVLLVAGPRAASLVNTEFAAANGKRLCDQPFNRICFGIWKSDGEELIVVRRAADRVEVHCHGGNAAASQIIETQVARGARQIEWPDWLRLSAANQLEAEAAIALTKAHTFNTAAILLDQQRGALRSVLESIQRFIEDTEYRSAIEEVERLLTRAEWGLRLTQPWKVTVCGRPNVGKSSLLNALLGYERAIVFDQPGTTRDIVTAWTAMGGWPIELSDSAGLRESTDALERAGVGLTGRHLRAVDRRILVMDAAAGVTGEDLRLLAEVSPELIALNKIDLCQSAPDMPSETTAAVICTSAQTGAGIEELIAAIADSLMPHPPQPGTAVPFMPSQLALLKTTLAAVRAGQQAAALAAVRELLD